MLRILVILCSNGKCRIAQTACDKPDKYDMIKRWNTRATPTCKEGLQVRTEAEVRNTALEEVAITVANERSSGENKDPWTMTRDLAFVDMERAIRALKTN